MLTIFVFLGDGNLLNHLIIKISNPNYQNFPTCPYICPSPFMCNVLHRKQPYGSADPFTHVISLINIYYLFFKILIRVLIKVLFQLFAHKSPLSIKYSRVSNGGNESWENSARKFKFSANFWIWVLDFCVFFF